LPSASAVVFRRVSEKGLHLPSASAVVFRRVSEKGVGKQGKISLG